MLMEVRESKRTEVLHILIINTSLPAFLRELALRPTSADAHQYRGLDDFDLFPSLL